MLLSISSIMNVGEFLITLLNAGKYSKSLLVPSDSHQTEIPRFDSCRLYVQTKPFAKILPLSFTTTTSSVVFAFVTKPIFFSGLFFNSAFISSTSF